MTPQEILDDINNAYSEHLEMMSIEEKYIIITRTLANKLAFEMAEKAHYKESFYKSLSSTNRINS